MFVFLLVESRPPPVLSCFIREGRWWSGGLLSPYCFVAIHIPHRDLILLLSFLHYSPLYFGGTTLFLCESVGRLSTLLFFPDGLTRYYGGIYIYENAHMDKTKTQLTTTAIPRGRGRTMGTQSPRADATIDIVRSRPRIEAWTGTAYRTRNGGIGTQGDVRSIRSILSNGNRLDPARSMEFPCPTSR